MVSKHAVNRFTEFLLTEYAKDGLLAYVIHPGGVKTEMGIRMPEHTHVFLTDTTTLGGDTLNWLTRERREWLAGRYISANFDLEEVESRKKEIVDGDKLKERLVL